MKRNLLLLIFLALGVRSFAISDKVRLGLAVAPGIGWSSALGNDVERGKARFGINYGFVFEYWFAKNYGLATGIGGNLDGCNLHSRDAFENNSLNVKVRNVTEKYTFNYLEIPAYLKLKTNEIKSSKICVWGQVGATIDITVSARATMDSISMPQYGDGAIFIEKENILRPSNDVTRSIPKFRSNFIDVRLGVGGGMEYRIDDKTSMVVGVFYHNGFINNIFDHDPKKEPNLMRSFNLSIGVLF